MKIEDEIKSTVALSVTKKVILNITFTRNHLGDNFNDLLKPYEISSEQYNVLRILRGKKGEPVNMSDIQERMIAKNSNTTRLIDKLLVKNYVDRKICPDNRRKMEITITEKGLTVLSELDSKVIDHENSFAENLTANELKLFIQLIEKYRKLN